LEKESRVFHGQETGRKKEEKVEEEEDKNKNKNN
jgi:hypothetical protein